MEKKLFPNESIIFLPAYVHVYTKQKHSIGY
jgi:hypothetical protein